MEIFSKSKTTYLKTVLEIVAFLSISFFFQIEFFNGFGIIMSKFDFVQLELAKFFSKTIEPTYNE